MSQQLYEWDNIEQFNLWHNALCTELGYPITGVNQATGLPDDNAQKVIAYTTPNQIGNKIVASVEDKYATGLILTNLRYPELPERTIP